MDTIPHIQSGDTIYASTLNRLIDGANGIGVPSGGFCNTPNGVVDTPDYFAVPKSGGDGEYNDTYFLRTEVRTLGKLHDRSDVSSTLSVYEDYYFINLGRDPEQAYEGLQWTRAKVRKILFCNTKEEDQETYHMDGILSVEDYGPTVSGELCAYYDGYINTGIYALSSDYFYGGFCKTLGEYELSGEGGVSSIVSSEYFYLFTDDFDYPDLSDRICDILEVPQLCAFSILQYQPIFTRTWDIGGYGSKQIQLAMGTQILAGGDADNNPWYVDATGKVSRAWATVGNYNFDTGVTSAANVSGHNWLVMDLNNMSCELGVSAVYNATQSSMLMFDYFSESGEVLYYCRQPYFNAWRRYTI